MSRTPVWRRYLRFFGADINADVGDELSFHLDTKVDELVAQGWTREAARVEARRQFGDITVVHEICEQLGTETHERAKRAQYFLGLRLDIVDGFRQLSKRWPTSLLAVLILGIGIGAVAAVFSMLHAVVLRPLPFPNPDRIVTVWSTREGHDDVVTPRNFAAWRHDSRSFTKLAALERTTFTLSDGGNATQVPGGEVTADFFSVFGVSPMFGRTFTSEEDRPPRLRLVVLSHRLWQERFAADRGVLGRQIHLNREPYTVIGVMPARFDLRSAGEQFWIPLALSDREMQWGSVLYVFGRLRPHLKLKEARSEMTVIGRALQARYPEMNRGCDIRVGEFAADLVGDYRQQLLILLGAVGSVLLIACANVANLLLARGAGRSRELNIRAALGASRSRIIRQLLTETFLLGLAGAVLGLLVTGGSIGIAKSVAANVVPRLGEASIDATVLIIVLGLALACTLVCGTLPALRAARTDLQSALGHSGRSSAGLARDRARNAYITVEVGLALVLLIAAGLLIRAAVAAQTVHPGFVPDRVVTGRTALPSRVYNTANQVVGAYERILRALASQPGVQSAAVTSKVPLGTSAMGVVVKPNAVAPPLKDQFSTDVQYVSVEYFRTMQIPLLRGREFSPHDRTGSAQVMLVNETLAHRLWPGQEAVGQTIRLNDLDFGSPVWEVIGVVADVHDDGLMAAPPAVLYVPFAQVPIHPWQWTEQALYLVARTHTLAGSETLQAALRQVDSELPLGDVRSMDQRLEQSMSAARFYTLVLTILGLCGLVLTAAGVYGVVAYFVGRQRAEIGIRIALGSTPAGVLLFVVRQGMRPVLSGIALGIIASLAASRALASQLYGVRPMDPLTFASVGFVLLAVAVLACYLPARQAVQVDPMIALRTE